MRYDFHAHCTQRPAHLDCHGLTRLSIDRIFDPDLVVVTQMFVRVRMSELTSPPPPPPTNKSPTFRTSPRPALPPHHTCPPASSPWLPLLLLLLPQLLPSLFLLPRFGFWRLGSRGGRCRQRCGVARAPVGVSGNLVESVVAFGHQRMWLCGTVYCWNGRPR